MKLETWYLEDNGWNKLWFYGINRNKWLIFDPDSGETLSIVPKLVDDDFIDNPPKEVKNQKAMFNKVFDAIFNKEIDVSVGADT